MGQFSERWRWQIGRLLPIVVLVIIAGLAWVLYQLATSADSSKGPQGSTSTPAASDDTAGVPAVTASADPPSLSRTKREVRDITIGFTEAFLSHAPDESPIARLARVERYCTEDFVRRLRNRPQSTMIQVGPESGDVSVQTYGDLVVGHFSVKDRTGDMHVNFLVTSVSDDSETVESGVHPSPLEVLLLLTNEGWRVDGAQLLTK